MGQDTEQFTRLCNNSLLNVANNVCLEEFNRGAVCSVMQTNYCGLIYRFSARIHRHTTAQPCSVGQVTAVFGASGRAANEPNTRLDNSHLLLLSCLCQTQQHPYSLTGRQQQPASHLGRTSSCENLNTHTNIHIDMNTWSHSSCPHRGRRMCAYSSDVHRC